MMMCYSGKRKAESGGGGRLRAVSTSLRAAASPPDPLSAPRDPLSARRGVTLIELLVTMVIIAIIAAAIMGTAAAAIEHARRSRTQQLVTRIHTLIMEQLATYETRRVEIKRAFEISLDGYVRSANGKDQYAQRAVERSQMLADLRLLGLRELIRYEMPDRFLDFGVGAANPNSLPEVLNAVPPLAQSYYRRVTQANANADNQDAECLYMVVMYATGDGEARTLFSKQDIGDTDDDGLPEFIDGWGKSIGWIRWAPGWVSDIQPDPIIDGPLPEVYHDPLDLYRRDHVSVTSPVASAFPVTNNVRAHIDELRGRAQRANPDISAYRLTPLIYSDGPDGESGILRVPIGQSTETIPELDPYAIRPNAPAPYGSLTNRDLAQDNIHNHLIDY